MIKIVELFAGIGGFRKGFADAAKETHREVSFEFVSEWDKFAQTSYEAIWGEKPQGDITKVDAKDIPDHDILVGGFPCQAFSTAGKMQGFDDTRGTLFFDMARIAEEKKPKAILMENVKGLVGHDKGRTLDIMVKTLNNIGYVVDFEVLNSKYYDVPQNRERIFIIAIREDLIGTQQWEINGNTVVPKGKKRIQGYGDAKTFNFNFPKSERVKYALRDILESDVPESFYLSEEKTETLVAELRRNEGVTNTGICGKTASLCTGENISSNVDANYAKGMGPSDIGKNRARRSHVLEGLPIKEATKKGYVIASEGDSVNVQYPNSKTRRGRVGKQIANTLEASGINQGIVVPVLTPDRENKRQNGRRFKNDGDPSFTLTAQDKHGVLLGVDAHSTSKKMEFQGFKQKEVAGTLLATGYKAPQCLLLGNVNPSGKGMNGNVFDANHLSPTLTTNKGQGIKVAENLRIRKLTPLECWRLQAFSDEDFTAAKDAGVSNSQLYKQAGNSVTTTVIKALALEIYDLLDSIAAGEELSPPQGQTNIFDFI